MNSASYAIPEVIKLRVIQAALTVFVVSVAVHGFMNNNKLELLVLGFLPVGIFLVNRLNWWHVMILATYNSWIYIPGFPPALSLYAVLLISICPVLIARRCIGPAIYPMSRPIKFMAGGYLVVVVGTMAARGMGLRFFGSAEWGGAAYIHLIAALMFFLLSDTELLTPKQWRMAVILFLASGVIPSAAEWVYVLSRGKAQFLYHVIKPDGAAAVASVAAIESGFGVLRFQVSKYITYLFTLALALCSFRGRGRVIICLTAMIAFLFAGLSGHRSSTFYLVALIPTVMLLRNPARAGMIITGYAIAFLLLCGLLAIAGEMLPLPFQRAVSWIPFAKVSWVARSSAEASTLWRIEVWKLMMPMISEYWVVGRGFTFAPPSQTMLEFLPSGRYERALITHSYHNGPLSMLVDLGALGLIFGSALMVFSAIRHLRLLRAEWKDTGLQQIHAVLLASYVVHFVRFYLIHGDPWNAVGFMLLQIFLLEGLYRSNRHDLDRAAGLAPSPVLVE